MLAVWVKMGSHFIENVLYEGLPFGTSKILELPNLILGRRNEAFFAKKSNDWVVLW